MGGPCPLRAACRGQDYCPCVVRGLLADYAELLEQREVWVPKTAQTEDGRTIRVKGKRPAYQVLEEQIARKADVAVALRDLAAAYPPTGRAVALAYGLALIDGRVAFIGHRDAATGKILTPPARTIATLLASEGRRRRGQRGGATRAVAHDLVRETIAEGVAWMARHLGWELRHDEDGPS